MTEIEKRARDSFQLLVDARWDETGLMATLDTLERHASAVGSKQAVASIQEARRYIQAASALVQTKLGAL